MRVQVIHVQDNTLMAVSVERQPVLRVGARPLFSGEAIHATLSDPANWRPRFDVAADGKRFVVIRNLNLHEGPLESAAAPDDPVHYVMLGGSWATDEALLRPSFRNWFQPHSPYVFSQFRCARPR